MARSDKRQLLYGSKLAAEITPRDVVTRRRALTTALTTSIGAALLSGIAPRAVLANTPAPPAGTGLAPLPGKPSRYSVFDRPVPYETATEYNNFIEFGFDKSDAAARAPSRLKVSPWQVAVTGLVAKPKTFDIDDLRRLAPMEERVSRLRCVEGWSMVIPWIGYSLSELLRQVQPLGSAKFVEFTTLADARQMPNLSSRAVRWPYTEGLRMDEAMHPLSMLAFGMYGSVMPAQSGAPVRLVVPWKYGFKSIKSIVGIKLVETQPDTLWNLAVPSEYGFYANVNPEVSHPRWSQATERVLGTGSFFAPRRKTEMFNGYAELVGSMYAGMDLRRHY